jgi:glycosyltransferase involved in cell wall biosynthesis
MAEKVTHGVDGLHFRAGDAADLARTLEYAVATPGLWEQLRAAIRPVYRMEEHVTALESLYGALLGKREVANVG